MVHPQQRICKKIASVPGINLIICRIIGYHIVHPEGICELKHHLDFLFFVEVVGEVDVGALNSGVSNEVEDSTHDEAIAVIAMVDADVPGFHYAQICRIQLRHQ